MFHLEEPGQLRLAAILSLALIASVLATIGGANQTSQVVMVLAVFGIGVFFGRAMERYDRREKVRQSLPGMLAYSVGRLLPPNLQEECHESPELRETVDDRLSKLVDAFALGKEPQMSQAITRLLPILVPYMKQCEKPAAVPLPDLVVMLFDNWYPFVLPKTVVKTIKDNVLRMGADDDLAHDSDETS